MSTIKELNKTATSYRLANDPAACLASSTLALTKDPSNAIANRNRTWVLFALRQYKDSRQACLIALGNRAKMAPGGTRKYDSLVLREFIAGSFV